MFVSLCLHVLHSCFKSIGWRVKIQHAASLSATTNSALDALK